MLRVHGSQRVRHDLSVLNNNNNKETTCSQSPCICKTQSSSSRKEAEAYPAHMLSRKGNPQTKKWAGGQVSRGLYTSPGPIARDTEYDRKSWSRKEENLGVQDALFGESGVVLQTVGETIPLPLTLSTDALFSLPSLTSSLTLSQDHWPICEIRKLIQNSYF